MDPEKKIERKIDGLLNRTNNGGFTKPPADYFDQFADSLIFEKSKKGRRIDFGLVHGKWGKVSTLAVAALVLLALWVFVFDAEITKSTDPSFTIDELLALSDFDNYNETLIYSELALVTDEELYTTDEEVELILSLDAISTDEIIELYSTDDIK